MSRRNQEARCLTPRQLEILGQIRETRRRHGYSPTMQELADEFQINKVTVFEHVSALVKKGLLRRLPNKARSLEPTDLAESLDDVRPTVFALAGRIAAGYPVEAFEDTETIDLETLFTRPGNVYVLQVRGDSMIDEQIRDGDYVVVEDRKNPRNGETVVAYLERGEATLKRFYRQGKKVRLEPANAAFQPIVVDGREVDIQGIVIGVVRRC